MPVIVMLVVIVVVLVFFRPPPRPPAVAGRETGERRARPERGRAEERAGGEGADPAEDGSDAPGRLGCGA